MKKFLSGILVGVLIMTSTIAYAETKKTIEAVFGRVKLTVDGKAVDKETLLYNGTTYVPLKAAAEVAGMEVGWDASTNTARLTSKPTAPAPAPTASPVATPKPTATPAGDKKELPFTISKIEYTFEVSPSYIRTWYGNRTKYTITSFSIHWFDKSDSRERYISNNQHVKPGELSDRFEGYGPKSGNADDIELMVTYVTFLNKNDEKVYLTYNHKTKEYTVTGDY